MTQAGAVLKAVPKVTVQVVAAEPVVSRRALSEPVNVGVVPQALRTGGTLPTVLTCVGKYTELTASTPIGPVASCDSWTPLMIFCASAPPRKQARISADGRRYFFISI